MTDEVSLRDSISAAMDEATAEPAQEVEVQEAPESGRDRDDKGRFAAKQEQEIVEAPKVLEAPSVWKSKLADKWGALDPSIQQALIEREAEVDKGFTKFDQERNFGKTVKEIVTPYMPIIQAEGGTPEGAIKDLLNTAYILRTGAPEQKKQLLMQVAQQYGVDLGGESNTPPEIQTLMNEINGLKQNWNQFNTLQKQQEEATIQTQVEAFKSDPAHIHFDKVRPMMATLLGNGHAKDLEEAYQMACKINPEVSAFMVSQQQAEAEAKKKQELTSKKAAAVSVAGAPGVAVPNQGNPNRSLREELEASFESAGVH